MPQQATQKSLTSNSPDICFIQTIVVARRTIERFGHCAIPEALMWAIAVVESDKLLVDMIEVVEAETHEVVQAFSLDCADPRFSKRVGVRRQNRCVESTNAGILKYAIKRV